MCIFPKTHTVFPFPKIWWQAFSQSGYEPTSTPARHIPLLKCLVGLGQLWGIGTLSILEMGILFLMKVNFSETAKPLSNHHQQPRPRIEPGSPTPALSWNLLLQFAEQPQKDFKRGNWQQPTASFLSTAFQSFQQMQLFATRLTISWKVDSLTSLPMCGIARERECVWVGESATETERERERNRVWLRNWHHHHHL